MIKITLSTVAGRTPDLFANEDASIREFLDEHDANYDAGVVYLDGRAVSDLDKTFAEMNITTSCRLTIVVKTQNAAKAVIAGNSFVVTSDAKLEDISLIQRMRPQALILTDEKTEAQVFAVATTSKSSGYLNEYGATFSTRTNAEGKATITMTLPEGVADAVEYVKENFSLALLQLNKLEKTFAEVLESIKKDQEAVAACITAI